MELGFLTVVFGKWQMMVEAAMEAAPDERFLVELVSRVV